MMNIVDRLLPQHGRTTVPAVVPPAPYRGAPIVQVQSDAGPMWIREDDGVIRPYLEINGTWEPEEGAMLRKLVRPGSTFVDVGANVGYFSRLLATVGQPARICAFEPHPELVDILRLNTWGLSPAVEVFTCALGDSTGTVVLQSSEHNYGDTRVSAATSAAATMVAPVARMDDMIQGPVDVVKIDVQGYETEVLRGMQRIIRENPRLMLIVEFWPGALTARGLVPRAVLEQYRMNGFVVALLRGGSPLEATNDEILAYCQSAGQDGQANLVLRKS